MTSKPPTPVAKSFLICRDIVQDGLTKEHILIRPVVDLAVQQIPCLANLHVFLHVTNGHGSYLPSLQLIDSHEQVVWSTSFSSPFLAQDPLRFVSLAFHNLGLSFNQAGRYDLVFLANEEEVARHPLWIGLRRPAPAGPGKVE